MQAYHSSLSSQDGIIGNMAILPFKTQFRGPAPIMMPSKDVDKEVDKDIVDEALYYFKANVFFRTYEIKVRLLTLLTILT